MAASLGCFVLAVSFGALLVGCGSDSTDGTSSGTGGLPGFFAGGAAGAFPGGAGGMAVASGGASANAGTTGGGGTASSGGASTSGGASGSGGSGGSAGSGGASNSGGASGSVTDGGDDASADAGDASAPGDASSDGGGGAGAESDGGTGPLADAGDAGRAPTFTGPCGTFPKIEDFTATGPLATTSAIEGPNCSIYRPTTLGARGAKHPVILWANGTGGPTFVYEAAFKLWASHGFIVAAGNSLSGQGSGAEILGCLDYVTTQSKTPGSPLEGKVCPRVGASGHSQGGGGALMAGQDSRVLVTAPLMPYIAEGFGGFTQACIPKQTGPMLLLSGTADTIAPPDVNQKPVFDGTNVPVFWGNLVGGDHVAVSLNGIATYREQMLAWYRLHLMGDETFRGNFYGPSCSLCADKAWIVQRQGIK